MIAFAALAVMLQDPEPPAPRTPSIYRCPAAEAESKFFTSLVDEHHFDSYCIEPKPGPKAKQVVVDSKLKVKFIDAKIIDTPANLKWRNATIDFVNGKISPKAWLEKTKNLGETVHFLSSPKTQKLREATNLEGGRAVFAELLVCSLPGKPCFTADDIWQTRYFPGPGRLESWILAMNDYLGPMLYGRTSDPFLATQQPKIIRADSKPGMLIFQYVSGKKKRTFFLNNGPTTLPLPDVDLGLCSGVQRGLDVEGPKPRLMSTGFLEEMLGDQ